MRDTSAVEAVGLVVGAGIVVATEIAVFAFLVWLTAHIVKSVFGA